MNPFQPGGSVLVGKGEVIAIVQKCVLFPWQQDALLLVKELKATFPIAVIQTKIFSSAAFAIFRIKVLF